MLININDKERSIFVKNLRKHPLYQYKSDIDLGPVNYLIANDCHYDFDKIKEYINNSRNIYFNYEHLVKKASDNVELKILGYFSLDSKNRHLIHIGKSNKFQIDLSNLPIDPENVNILEMPFYAIVTLTENDDPETSKQIPYCVNNLEFIEAIKFNLEDFKKLRSTYSTKEWFDLVIKTLGYNPNKFTTYEKFNFLLRLIPYCTRKFHYLELGNKETGKSFFYSEISERFSKLLTADSLTIPQNIYDENKNKEGFIATKNILGIDEIVDTNFKNKEIITAFQTYLQDGKVSRGNHTIKGKSSVVLIGNIKNVESNLTDSISLFDQFNSEIKNETFFDKFYYFSPSWKTAKINAEEDQCDDSEERLSLDFFINSLTRLRDEDDYYDAVVSNHIKFKGTDSGRDSRIKKTVAGLLKILHPDGNVTQDEIETYTYIALSGRKLLLDQLNIKNSDEYTNSLYAMSQKSNLEINANNYYKLSIIFSEKLFSEYNLNLDDIEYYYYDYEYFDRSKFENKTDEKKGQTLSTRIKINANELNKKLGFELVEPRMAIKFKRDNHIYKLALSTYGINANIIEYYESQNNQKNDIEFLDELFTLIKCNNFEKPQNVFKLNYFPNIFWNKLKEENKDNTKIMSLIHKFENIDKKIDTVIEENIELKEKINSLENEVQTNSKTIEEINFYINKITYNFNNHKHHTYYNRFLREIEVDTISTTPLSEENVESKLNFNFSYNGHSRRKITIFDYEKIKKLKESYIKIKMNVDSTKNSQN